MRVTQDLGSVIGIPAGFGSVAARNVEDGGGIDVSVETSGTDDAKDIEFTFYNLEMLVQNVLLDRIYPVGKWWISDDPTDPGEIVGGTWEKVSGVLLKANGDTKIEGSDSVVLAWIIFQGTVILWHILMECHTIMRIRELRVPQVHIITHGKV